MGIGPAYAESAAGSVTSVGTQPAEWALPSAGVSRTIEYRTEWEPGSSATDTAVLFLPAGEAPDGGWPIVAWAHGTVGLADECAPSRTPRTDRDSAYLEHWLSQGYAVVASDYPGLGGDGLHRYLDGASAANSIVDGVRAARSAEPTLANRWVVVGQSQGGHAALHTAHIATTRAPELDYRGMVATGAPSNLELVFPAGSPEFPELGLTGLTAFSAYILAGMRDANALDVDEYLTPLGLDVVDATESLCYEDLVDRYGHVGVGQMLSRPLSDETARAALTDYLAVPTSGYDRPLFLAQGLIDTVVPAPLVYPLVADLQAEGEDVRFFTYPTTHSGTMAASLPDSTPFVASLLAP